MKKLTTLLLCMLMLFIVGCKSKSVEEMSKHNYFGYNIELPKSFEIKEKSENEVGFIDEKNKRVAILKLTVNNNNISKEKMIEVSKKNLVESKVIENKNYIIVKGQMKNSNRIHYNCIFKGDNEYILFSTSSEDEIKDIEYILKSISKSK